MKIIKNIIFSGGAFKGWAYIGTIKALNENIPFKNIEQIIGVSVGSIFGLVYLLQLDPGFLINFIINLDFKSIMDIDLDSIIVNQSMLEGKEFKKIVLELCNLNENITFQELFLQTSVLFTTCAYNVDKIQLEYFNKNLTPDVKVIDALIASCALPLLFPAYKIGNDFYYDGGICNNCPCNLVNPKTSIAFDLCPRIVKSEYNILNLISGLTNLINNHFSNNFNFKFNIVDEKFDNQVFNINQSKDEIFNIYMNGYNNTNKIFNFIF